MTTKHSALAVSVLVLLGSLIHTPICTAEQFHSTSYGYHLDLPQGWVKIPQNVLQETFAAFLKQNAATIIIYDAGFQLDSAKRWLEYPYVLVQSLPYDKCGLHRQINEDEFPKYVRMMAGLDADSLVDKIVSSDARHLLGKLDVGKPKLDTGNRRYLWTMDIDVQGIGPVRGLVVGYFGRDLIVQVIFYSRHADWDRHSDARWAIVDSFRFDPHKAYSTQLAATNPSPPSIWSRVLEKGIIGAFTGGILALVLGGAAMAKRKKSATAEDAADEDTR